MKNTRFSHHLLLTMFCLLSINGNTQDKPVSIKNAKGQSVYEDIPYWESFSVRYYFPDSNGLHKAGGVSVNRDNQVRILSGKGLLVPDNGSFFYPGGFLQDISYPAIMSKKISAIITYHQQTIYLDDKQIFSNAWAGKLQIEHGLPNASIVAGGKDFHFMVSDGQNLVYLDSSGRKIWSGSFKNTIQIRYRESTNTFLLVSPEMVAECTPGLPIRELYKGSAITSALEFGKEKKIAISTKKGYFILPDKNVMDKLPCPDITCMQEINGQLWFGSAWGAFRLNADGKYSYFSGERWLPGNKVIQIEEGPDNSVLVLTTTGLGKIYFKKWTLEDKALFFEKQVREKNIRYGFNCSSVKIKDSYSSGQTGHQPSDNLWTGMYLAGQLFRYKVTGSAEAKQNAFESFEALERLHTVTGIPGLFARSFERDYKIENVQDSGWQQKELVSGSPASLWLSAADHHNWTWRSTASSDQAVGQIFALTAILELADDKAWKMRALKCLDNLMGYILENNLYIIDVDGKPTLWGKWNPEYVNAFAKNVGDRKITSSNIIAFLQTAYKFTGKEKYKTKAYELMEKFGYLDNLMQPMAEIGSNENDPLSKVLSEGWNHSDDEMYFLAYWGLYPYAFSSTLKEKYRAAIRDHWNIERPEQNALWNFSYAMTGARDFDLSQSINFLKTYPVDLRNHGMHNSHRMDISFMPQNFRGQTTKELLPLNELPVYRHNGQIFTLDSDGDGKSLISAGDTWLLPYWMGRYLGVISASVPTQKRQSK
ncbi:MAG: hypothetical protein ABIU77_10225 [Ferruginibacter sp.]